MTKVRVAVIGAGQMANRVHYPSLASLPDVNIVAACDLDEARLRQTAQRWGIGRCFAEYRDMIEACSPDAVYAIGPPHVMYPVWLRCLDMGVHLFVEKPLGVSVSQAHALAELAERRGCITQVGFQRRTSPMVTMLREQCLRRGPVTYAVCRFYKNDLSAFPGPYGRMHDDGVHAIDTLRWMCGGAVTRVQGVTREISVPDVNVAAAVLSFGNGATGVMLFNYASGRRVFSVEMHGPGMCVEAEHEGAGVVYADGDTTGVRYDAREVAGSDELFVYGGFQAKTKEFIECVRSGKQPSSCFSDALQTMEVADELLKLAASDRR